MRERKYADKVQLSDKRRAEIRKRTARYAATDVFLRKLTHRKHLTKEEYAFLSDALAKRCSLPLNSVFRDEIR